MKKLTFLLVLIAIFVDAGFSQNIYFYQIPSGTNSNLSSIYSVSSNIHLISGMNGTVLRSTNTGATSWSSIALGTSVDLSGFMLKNNLSSNVQYVFGKSGTLYLSTNYGANWSVQASNTVNNLNAGTVVMGDSVQQYKYLIVGDNGAIIYKFVVPGTGNWIPLTGVTNSNLKTVYSVGKYVWAGGPYGFIMKSNNSGMNWTQQLTGTMSEINSICFRSTSLGFAVGNGGLILKTTNGGVNWYQISGGTIQNLNQVIWSGLISDSSSYWITGNAGVVLRTTNAGITWQNDIYAPNVNFSSCSYINNYLYLVGDAGRIYKRSLDTNYHYIFQGTLSGNNIKSFFSKSGVFDQDRRYQNMAGFYWPKDSNRTAIFTAGLTIGAKVNGELRMAAASFTGEYSPGYCVNGNFYTDTNIFKYYSYTKGVDTRTSWDWMNWGLMVPYGAPFIDVNSNGTFEYQVDTPGVRYAKQTLFICLTDADTASHKAGEGFGGGTLPLGSEIHLTAWAYESPNYLQNVQFIQFEVINKSLNSWNAVKMGIVSDPDLGDSNDDYIGCDTNLNLGFCYNGDNNDYQYGICPPAVGFVVLRGNLNRNVTPNATLKMTSFTKFVCGGCPAPLCEVDPNGEPYPAYLMLSGYKKDSTCWLNPTFNPPKKTKFIHTGDPETNTGWNEIQGSIWNCNRDSTGAVVAPNAPGDRRLLIGSGAENFKIVPGERQRFVIAQLIVRGNNNLNSVTRLKQLTDSVRIFYEQNFPIGINQISNSIPEKYNLFQNYPNPFNPVTSIRYQIPKSNMVSLKVYDILGREIETLVNEVQMAGIYEVQFPGNSNTSLASGIYFYRLTAGDFTSVKRMVLIK